MARGEVDLLVGIDFGMTCTGVAYAKKNMDSPKMIQEWPRPPHKHGMHNKVPSTLLYDKDKKTVKEWGFTTNDDRETIEWFKRYLDDKYLTNMVAKNKTRKQPLKLPFERIEEARKVYGDYMKCLYKHITAQLTKYEDWKDKSVEFVFSLPATFRSLEVSAGLLEQIKKAGFGSGGKKHKVSWGLSEPQAAAVHTAKEVNLCLRKGNIILVCDAGGGTTDLALLEQYGDEDVSDLREISIVQGKDIGSTNIDLAFLSLVTKRLAKAAGKLTFDKNAATIMMHSDEFQTWKHEFGKVKESQFSVVRVTVPIIKGGMADKEAGITDGKMNFTHKDFQSLFDPQVNGIVKFIQDMINKVAETKPDEKPHYLVLSGGLGSSAYVQQKLRAAFPDPKVVVADGDDPQLSVVKGLILDRKQRDRHGISALSVRKARASYGVVTSERYNKHNPSHRNLPRVRSELDNQEWVDDMIVWVIKKGQDIDATDEGASKKHKFYKSFRGKDNPGISKRELVICHLDPGVDGGSLPVRKGDADVFALCTVESDLSGVGREYIETRVVKGGGGNGGNGGNGWGGFFGGSKTSKYYEIAYDVKFVVGAIDARFELWIGEKQYAGRNSFKVAWEDEGLKSSSG
ncbi:hypothetical protein QBC44DRAFT_284471 [Cladorrhinum sp. PSN332]|nr:hypothetical protein QBC44DRAFT_284471 [Cladorrhinum sp. PSN332]